MRVKPRFTSEVVAIKVEEDILAESGSYLILGPKDTIAIIPKEVGDRLFEFTTEQQTKPEQPSKLVCDEPAPPSPSKPAPEQKKVNQKGGRLGTEQQILLAFGPMTDGTFLKNVPASTLGKVLNKVPPSLLLDRMARLIRAKKLAAKTQGDRVVYNITNAGEVTTREVRTRHRLNSLNGHAI